MNINGKLIQSLFLLCL